MLTQAHGIGLLPVGSTVLHDFDDLSSVSLRSVTGLATTWTVRTGPYALPSQSAWRFAIRSDRRGHVRVRDQPQHLCSVPSSVFVRPVMTGLETVLLWPYESKRSSRGAIAAGWGGLRSSRPDDLGHANALISALLPVSARPLMWAAATGHA